MSILERLGLIKANSVETKASPQSLPDPMMMASADDVFKAYVPNFIYKPPYGFPREENLVYIRKLALCPYIFSVIKTLCDEVSTVSYEIVSEKDEEKLEWEEKISQINNFFRRPNLNKESFEHLLRQWIKDLGEIDSAVCVKVFNDAEPEKKRMQQIFARAGESFLKNPNIYGYLGDRDEFVDPVYLEGMANEQRKEYEKNNQDQIRRMYDTVFSQTAAYFQYGQTAGSMPVPFGTREIIYMMQNPRTDSVYGRSPVHILGDIILNLLYSVSYNLDFFINSNMPEGVLSIIGANKETLKSLSERMRQKIRTTDSLGNERRTGFLFPVVDVDAKFVPFKLSSHDLELITSQQWFVKLVWAVFGVTPDEMGFCYSEDTRVLTDNGLKYHWEIKENDKIATINNDKIEYIKPTEIHRFDVTDANFHHYKNNCVDVLVSENHRMHYKTNKCKEWKMNQSNEINVNTIKFKQGGLDWVGNDIEEIKIPLIEYNNNKNKNREQQVVFKTDEFCEFIGYYLSEGSVLKDMDEKRQYIIKISQTNEENIKVMQPLMDKLGFRREKTNWALNNKSLAIYLNTFGNSNEKYIPTEIKNLPKEKLNILFNALMVGDGWKSKTGTCMRYYSSSKKLTEDVLEISLKLGYKASIKETEFKNKAWHNAYTLNINSTQKHPRIVISKQRENKKYTGIMWCPSVDNRAFITERNGKIGIHYNTETSNRAVSTEQAKVFKRKALRPMLNIIENHINMEIMPEFFMDEFKDFKEAQLNCPLRFKFIDYDMEDDKKKHEIYMMEITMGVRTPEMVAKELGIDVDELKKSKEENMQKQQEMMGNEKEENEENKKEEKKEAFYNKSISLLYSEGVNEAEVELNRNFPELKGLTENILVGFLTAGLSLVTTLNDTQKLKARGIFTNAIVGNWNYSDIVNALVGIDTNKEDAERIVRTEMTFAKNFGKMMSYKQAGIKDKRWRATIDDKTCSVCKALNGQEKPMDGLFDVEGKALFSPPAHPNCYSEDTEVYTNKGWLHFNELQGEKILSLNPETSGVEWQDYINYVEYPYNGEMISFTNRVCDLLVTPEHNMVITGRPHDNDRSKYEYYSEPASKTAIRKEITIPSSSKWEGNDINYMQIADKKIPMDLFMKFMGYYLSEGSTTKRTENNYQIKISQKDPTEIYNDIKGLPYNVNLGKESIYINNVELGKYLIQFGKSYEKYIPSNLKELLPSYLETFLAAYCYGDGSTVKGKDWKGIKFNDSRLFFTSSNRLAGDIGELIIKTGKTPSYRLNKCKGKLQKFNNGNYIINNDVWVVSECNHTHKQPNVKKIDYSGIVYDVELPNHHILLVRRNGKVCWSGNCRCSIQAAVKL